MSKRITINEDLQIIHVKSYGDVTPGNFKESHDTILKIRQERGISKVFVDATKVTSYPPTIDIHDFGMQLAKTFKGVKFAVAVPLGVEGPKFFEDVTHNRGASVKIFKSPDDALAWLTEKPELRQV